MKFNIEVDDDVVNGLTGLASQGELADRIEEIIKAGLAMGGHYNVRVLCEPQREGTVEK